MTAEERSAQALEDIRDELRAVRAMLDQLAAAEATVRPKVLAMLDSAARNPLLSRLLAK